MGNRLLLGKPCESSLVHAGRVQTSQHYRARLKEDILYLKLKVTYGFSPTCQMASLASFCLQSKLWKDKETLEHSAWWNQMEIVFFPLKQQYTIEEKLNPSPAADGPVWQSRAIFIQFCLPFAFSALAFVKIRSVGFVLSCLKLLWQKMQVDYPNFHF